MRCDTQLPILRKSWIDALTLHSLKVFQVFKNYNCMLHYPHNLSLYCQAYEANTFAPLELDEVDLESPRLHQSQRKLILKILGLIQKIYMENHLSVQSNPLQAKSGLGVGNCQNIHPFLQLCSRILRRAKSLSQVCY